MFAALLTKVVTRIMHMHTVPHNYVAKYSVDQFPSYLGKALSRLQNVKGDSILDVGCESCK